MAYHKSWTNSDLIEDMIARKYPGYTELHTFLTVMHGGEFYAVSLIQKGDSRMAIFSQRRCDGYRFFYETKETIEFADKTEGNEVDGPYPIRVGGLDGHCIYCLGACRSQYVVSLDIGGYGFICGYGPTGNTAERIDRIEVTITIDREEDNKDAEQAIKAVAADPSFVSLLESIRV